MYRAHIENMDFEVNIRPLPCNCSENERGVSHFNSMNMKKIRLTKIFRLFYCPILKYSSKITVIICFKANHWKPYSFISFIFIGNLKTFAVKVLCYHRDNTKISLLLVTFREGVIALIGASRSRLDFQY